MLTFPFVLALEARDRTEQQLTDALLEQLDDHRRNGSGDGSSGGGGGGVNNGDGRRRSSERRGAASAAETHHGNAIRRGNHHNGDVVCVSEEQFAGRNARHSLRMHCIFPQCKIIMTKVE